MSDTGAADEVQQGGKLDQPRKLESDQLTPLVVLLLTVVLLWFGYWFAVSRYVAEQSQGIFGDMFGGLNALFSALAFAGLIYTVLLQRTELRLQREELVATREELKGQKVQLEIQNLVLRQQSFENTFFEMMRRHEDIVNTIEIGVTHNEVVRGRRAFGIFFGEFQRAYSEATKRAPLLHPLQHVQSAYAEFFHTRQSEIGHYFRNLYHMVKLVADRDLMVPPTVPEEATNLLSNRRYSALIRAQLSSSEHLLLFYNGLSEYGIEKFKPLIERFALLENMPWNSLIFPHHHLDLYDHAAYGDMKIDPRDPISRLTTRPVVNSDD